MTLCPTVKYPESSNSSWLVLYYSNIWELLESGPYNPFYLFLKNLFSYLFPHTCMRGGMNGQGERGTATHVWVSTEVSEEGTGSPGAG